MRGEIGNRYVGLPGRFLGRFAMLVMAGMVTVAPARSQTLQESLSGAYVTNPQLDAARANLRAVDETVPQARALARPSAGASISNGPAWTRSNLLPPPRVIRTNPTNIGVSVTQPIYQGGRIDASIDQAESRVQAERATLHDTEQTILLQAAVSYFDVARDYSALDLQVNFESFQKRDLEAFRDRFRVGEVTQTDVSLQEAQFANATAQRVAAEGSLASSRATFTRLMGAPPGRLSLPRLNYPLPATLEETVALAQAHNPRVVNAQFSETVANKAVDISDAALLPTLGVTATVARNLERSFPDDYTNSASVIATLTIPLDNGAVAARSRGARQSANAARINIEQAKRAAREAAISGWQTLTTVRASIASFQAAVKANEMAAEGMRQQVQVGASTVIDLLNTEQQLLNPRVNLLRAQHDEDAAIFTVLAAVGNLTARTLSLPVEYYDYEAHYNAVRNKWFGIGTDE